MKRKLFRLVTPHLLHNRVGYFQTLWKNFTIFRCFQKLKFHSEFYQTLIFFPNKGEVLWLQRNLFKAKVKFCAAFQMQKPFKIWNRAHEKSLNGVFTSVKAYAYRPARKRRKRFLTWKRKKEGIFIERFNIIRSLETKTWATLNNDIDILFQGLFCEDVIDCLHIVKITKLKLRGLFGYTGLLWARAWWKKHSKCCW